MWSSAVRKAVFGLKVFTFLLAFFLSWYAYYYYAFPYVEPTSRLYSTATMAFCTAVVVYLLVLYVSRKFLEATLYPRVPSFWEEVRKLRRIRGFKIAFLLLILASIVLGLTAPYEVEAHHVYVFHNGEGVLDFVNITFYAHQWHYNVRVVSVEADARVSYSIKQVPHSVPFFPGVFDKQISVVFRDLKGDAIIEIENEQVCSLVSYMPVFWRCYHVRKGNATDTGSIDVVLTIVGARIVEKQSKKFKVSLETKDVDRFAYVGDAFWGKRGWSEAMFRLFHGDVTPICAVPELYAEWVVSALPLVEEFAWWAEGAILSLAEAFVAASYDFMAAYAVIPLEIRFKVLLLAGMWTVVFLVVYLLRK